MNGKHASAPTALGGGLLAGLMIALAWVLLSRAMFRPRFSFLATGLSLLLPAVTAGLFLRAGGRPGLSLPTAVPVSALTCLGCLFSPPVSGLMYGDGGFEAMHLILMPAQLLLFFAAVLMAVGCETLIRMAPHGVEAKEETT